MSIPTNKPSFPPNPYSGSFLQSSKESNGEVKKITTNNNNNNSQDDAQEKVIIELREKLGELPLNPSKKLHGRANTLGTEKNTPPNSSPPPLNNTLRSNSLKSSPLISPLINHPSPSTSPKSHSPKSSSLLSRGNSFVQKTRQLLSNSVESRIAKFVDESNASLFSFFKNSLEQRDRTLISSFKEFGIKQVKAQAKTVNEYLINQWLGELTLSQTMTKDRLDNLTSLKATLEKYSSQDDEEMAYVKQTVLFLCDLLNSPNIDSFAKKLEEKSDSDFTLFTLLLRAIGAETKEEKEKVLQWTSKNKPRELMDLMINQLYFSSHLINHPTSFKLIDLETYRLTKVDLQQDVHPCINEGFKKLNVEISDSASGQMSISDKEAADYLFKVINDPKAMHRDDLKLISEDTLLWLQYRLTGLFRDLKAAKFDLRFIKPSFANYSSSKISATISKTDAGYTVTRWIPWELHFGEQQDTQKLADFELRYTLEKGKGTLEIVSFSFLPNVSSDMQLHFFSLVKANE